MTAGGCVARTDETGDHKGGEEEKDSLLGLFVALDNHGFCGSVHVVGCLVGGCERGEEEEGEKGAMKMEINFL